MKQQVRHAADQSKPLGRRGPRKVVVGTSMYNMWRTGHPGLEKRLGELAGLVDRMAAVAEEDYPGRGLDIAALPEAAVTGEGPASEIAVPLKGPVLDIMAAAARRHGCYVVVPLYLIEDGEKGQRFNAAVLLGRQGEVVGIYRKVFPVIDRNTELAEGGVAPGSDFPVFNCDFGRLGVQICYDMAFGDGWEALDRKGAELVIWTSQWASQVYPSSRALQHGYFVLSSTWSSNASLTDPMGRVVRDIQGEDGVFVEQIDLDYVILPWQRELREGKLFDEKYGDRAGYRYSKAEASGIFWSNDPDKPIMQMVRELGLESWPEETERSRKVQDSLRGGAAPGAT